MKQTIEKINEAFEVARLAKERGFATRARKGKLQFVTVVYDEAGRSTVTAHTGYMPPAAAREVLESL